MTLATSGTISIGGSTATRSINLELGRAANASSSLNETALRSLAGVASGTISLSNFYGKSFWSVANPISGLQGAFLEDGRLGPDDAFVNLTLYSNGTYLAYGSQGDIASGNWGSPTTTNKGSEYWVRFTRTANASSGGSSSAGSTTWFQLNQERGVSVLVTNDAFGLADSTYTIDLSTSSTGTPIVSTTTGVRLYALVEI